MPSYKPKVQILLTEEYHQKFKSLCEAERRSDSVMGALMIEKYIKDYEAEHGEIVIREPAKPEMRIPLLDPYHLGVKTGEMAADIVIDQVKKRKAKKQEPTERPG